jgi:hypothetical protein
MSSLPDGVRRLIGPRAILALAAIATLAAATVLLSGRGTQARADAASEYASYPALASTAPTGLTLVSAPASAPASAPGGPTWPLDPPGGPHSGWPIGSSIRRVAVDTSAISVWIAKAIGGGVCVLLSPNESTHGVYGVGYSCSTGEGDLAQGATVEASALPGAAGTVYVAGVVPNDVSSVRVELADGSTVSAPVSDDAWALEAEAPPIAYHPIPMGG